MLLSFAIAALAIIDAKSNAHANLQETLKILFTAIPIAVSLVIGVIPVMFCIDDTGQAKKDLWGELFWIIVPGGVGVVLCWMFVNPATAFIWVCAILIVINGKLAARALRSISNSQIDYKLVLRDVPDFLKPLLGTYTRGTAECVQSSSVAELEKSFVSMVNDHGNECRSIRPSEKGKVYIVQCSFIPVDKEGNTIVVSRTSKYHMSLAESIKKIFRKKFSLISFSPIPLRYEYSYSTTFDDHDKVLACYHREVPINDGGEEPKITFAGVVYREVLKDGLSVWQKAINAVYKLLKKRMFFEEDQRPRGRYIFGVYIAHYSRLSFLRDDVVDWNVVNRLFAQGGETARGKGRFFVKDHDEIVDVENIGVLAKKADLDPRWEEVEKRALKLANGRCPWRLT